jgi:hypothetical protein
METPTISNRDELIQITVQRMKAIQTVDDLKSSQKEIMDLIEKIMKSAVEALKNFVENIFQFTAEEREEKSKQFQDDDYFLDSRIMDELKRLDTIPGSQEIGEAFGKEMEERMGPYMEEFAQNAGKLMENFMGGLTEGLATAMGAGQNQEDGEPEDVFEFDYNNPDTPEMLYYLYDSRNLENLRENKTYLLESLEEQLQSDIWDMEVFADLDLDMVIESDKTRLANIRKRWERFEPELDKEFDRIAALPEAKNEALKIKLEIKGKVIDKLHDLRAYIEKVKF